MYVWLSVCVCVCVCVCACLIACYKCYNVNLAITAVIRNWPPHNHWLWHIVFCRISRCSIDAFLGCLWDCASNLFPWSCDAHAAQVVDAAEMDFDYLPTQHAGMLVLSQSGETKDVQRGLSLDACSTSDWCMIALALAQEHNVPTFSVVNVVRSLIARTTGCGVYLHFWIESRRVLTYLVRYLNAGRENAVASTKAFTCQVTVLSLIAVWFTQYKHTESMLCIFDCSLISIQQKSMKGSALTSFKLFTDFPPTWECPFISFESLAKALPSRFVM